jgi:hypothetical protein
MLNIMEGSQITPGAAVLEPPDRLCRDSLPKNKEVPSSVRRRVLEEYGMANAPEKAYEVDYLIIYATFSEWKGLIGRHAGFFNYDPETRGYCMITVPAPWRDTPGPTWQLVAAIDLGGIISIA